MWLLGGPWLTATPLAALPLPHGLIGRTSAPRRSLPFASRSLVAPHASPVAVPCAIATCRRRGLTPSVEPAAVPLPADGSASLFSYPPCLSLVVLLAIEPWADQGAFRKGRS